jgi:hypothetical protein
MFLIFLDYILKVSDLLDKLRPFIHRKKKVGGFSDYPYNERIGMKHRFLRKNILKVKELDIALLYNINKVSDIENYENGNIELPITYRKKLERFFYLDPDFLDTESSSIFQSFDLYDRSVISSFFNMGYTPIILTSSNMSCYIVFYIEQDGLMRVCTSDLAGSFHRKSGGGAINLQNFIEVLVNLEIDYTKIKIVKVNNFIWESLIHNTFYDNNFQCLGKADNNCRIRLKEMINETKVQLHDSVMHKFRENDS